MDKKDEARKNADQEKKKNQEKKELNSEELDKVSGGFPGAPDPSHHHRR